MPLLTIENKAAGLGQPRTNAFGPVSQFSSTLATELLMAPGSKVTLKRAKFTVSAETFRITEDNNKWAVVVNYDSDTAPPVGYDSVEQTASGLVLKGEVRPGMYNGDQLAQAIQDSLNERLKANELFSDKEISFEVVFTDSLTTATGKGSDSFTISMTEDKASVEITNGVKFPGSFAVFDDSPDRGGRISDYARHSGDILPVVEGETFLKLRKGKYADLRLFKNDLKTNVIWQDALETLNTRFISPATNVYNSLPLPAGDGDTSRCEAYFPIYTLDGSDASDNEFACHSVFSMYIGLLSNERAVQLNNQYGGQEAFPLTALNVFEREKGFTMASALRVVVNPDVSGGVLTGNAIVAFETLRSRFGTDFATADLASFHANTEITEPLKALGGSQTTRALLKTGMTASDPVMQVPIKAHCERNGADGNWTVYIQVEPGADDLIYDDDGSDVTVFGKAETEIKIEPGYIPVVFLGQEFTQDYQLGPISKPTLDGANIWAGVRQNLYKVSTTDATLAEGTSSRGVANETEADANTYGDPVFFAAYVRDDDDTEDLFCGVEISFFEGNSSATETTEFDVSHIEDGTEFDISFSSSEWRNILVEYADVFNRAGDKDQFFVLPLRVTHGSAAHLGNPYATEVLDRLFASDGEADHPAWKTAQLQHDRGASSGPTLTRLENGDTPTDHSYAVYYPAREITLGESHTSWSVRFTKEAGVNTVKLDFPQGSYTYDTTARTTALPPNPYREYSLTDLHVETLPVVHHASNLRGAPPLVTYKGDLGRAPLTHENHEPLHADETTDAMAYGSDHVSGGGKYKGQLLYLNNLWSLLGFYVPGESKVDASWVQFTSGTSVKSNTETRALDTHGGIAVHLRNIPISSYLSNGQSARVVAFIDDDVKQSEVHSTIVNGRETKIYELHYEPEDATQHTVQTTQTLRLRNLDVLLTDFGGRTLNDNTITATNPLFGCSLTLDVSLPNPLLERLAAAGGANGGEASPSKRAKTSASYT